MHFFTSVTINYVPKARVLAKSVKRHNQEAKFHLVLADKLRPNVVLDDALFDSVVQIDEMGIEDFEAWVFKHSVVELCTAIKGKAFLKIFETTGACKLVYLDPDIVVLSPLEELEKLLDIHDIILTPHQVEPDREYQAIIDNEICSLKHGVYNLGFLAVARRNEGLRFLRWWSRRLLQFCYDDIPNGLFTDQKWVDIAPCFFNVHILRDKTYNVATWNLTHRRVGCDTKNRLVVEGEPVKFFHFSGFDSGDQEIMLRKYAPNGSPLFHFRRWYMKELAREGQQIFGHIAPFYNFFSNGEPIPYEARQLYRSRTDLMMAFPRPFMVTEDGNCYYYWFKKYGQQGVNTRIGGLTEGDKVLLWLRKTPMWKLGRKIWFSNRAVRRLLEKYLKDSIYL